MSDWISVKDRLPDRNKAVFGVLAETHNCFGDKQFITAAFDKIERCFRLIRFDEKLGKKVDVTHWKEIGPLPK